MNLTEKEVLNLLSTQRLTNENFQLRDLVQNLSAQLAQAVEKLKEYTDNEDQPETAE